MSLKQEIINLINSQLQENISTLKKSISSSKESRDNDTKSSAGDKFETSREIINTEIQKGEVQLSKLFRLQNDLSIINTKKKFTNVEFGSLVTTNNFSYFISIPFGKISIHGKLYYAISLASPLGQQIFKKAKGDIISFNGNNFEILSID